jgi:leucyl-tRNA synthetase
VTDSRRYDPTQIETKWQRIWEEHGTFYARPGRGEKFYCYNPAPYVTGALHMGHVRNYSYGDFLSRYRRLRGSNVLYTLGFDAFGVPTEVAAMRNRVDPVLWTQRCIAEMRRQLARMGFGFDWRRTFSTADPDYYRWTQWIFIEMFRDGLIYECEASTLWCPACDTALAKSLAEDDHCFLCGADVETRITRQWFLRISSYLGRLRADLAEVRDLNGQARAGQESLLATRSMWALWLVEPKSGAKILAVMGTPADWSRPLSLSVHPEDWPSRRILGLDAGGHAIVVEPLSGRVIGARVDPTLDEIHSDRPRLVADRSGSVGGEIERPPENLIFPFALEEQKDFSISRQRLWGTPIPMVHCGRCGATPIEDAELPVLLPRIEADAMGRLRRDESGMPARVCPSCGGSAVPDPQVMDCHFDALWHYIRPCVTSTATIPFGSDEARYWMPVDQIQFGRDTIPFLLTLRLFTKFLQDRGLSDCSEFAREMLAHGLILKDNRKMSKHIGNVVDPSEMIERVGADSLRFYIIARNEPKSDYGWSDASLARYGELLRDFHADLDGVFDERADVAGSSDSSPGGGALSDPRSGVGDAGSPRSSGPRFGGSRKYTSIFLSKVLHEVEVLESSVEEGRFDIYARAVGRILEALHLFRSRFYGSADAHTRQAWRRCAERTIVYLAPIAPHLAEECWERSGRTVPLFDGANWPAGGVEEIRGLLEDVRKGNDS